MTGVTPHPHTRAPELGPAKPWPRSMLLLWFLVSPVWLSLEFTLRFAYLLVMFFGDGSDAPTVLPVLGRWVTPSRLVREWSRDPARWEQHLDRTMASISDYLQRPSPHPYPKTPSLRLTIRHRPERDGLFYINGRDYHGAGVGALVEAAHRHGLAVMFEAQTTKKPSSLSPETQSRLLDWLAYWKQQKTVTPNTTVESVLAAGRRNRWVTVDTKQALKDLSRLRASL